MKGSSRLATRFVLLSTLLASQPACTHVTHITGELDADQDRVVAPDETDTSGAELTPGVCGNAVVEGDEACDDGNDAPWDGCHLCQVTEFLVNTHTAGEQVLPAVDVSDSGHAVVVWQSYSQDGSEWGVYAQRYGPVGRPLGEEIRANAAVVGGQEHADVAVGPDGQFVVVWESWSHGGIWARCFDPEGRRTTDEFRVNRSTDEDRRVPAVAMAADGSFVVVWEAWGQDGDGPGIFARSFTPECEGGEVFGVNTYVTQDQSGPDIHMAPSGRFVVAWQSWGQDGDEFGIFARVFEDPASPTGAELQVNPWGEGFQLAPAVAMAGDGTFIAVWSHYGATGGPSRVFTAEGTPVVETPARGATVAMASDHSIVWALEAQGHTDWEQDVQAYRMTGDEVRQLETSTHTTGDQLTPASAMTQDGRLILVWQSRDQDGDAGGIFAQRYAADGSSLGLMAW